MNVKNGCIDLFTVALAGVDIQSKTCSAMDRNLSTAAYLDHRTRDMDKPSPAVVSERRDEQIQKLELTTREQTHQLAHFRSIIAFGEQQRKRLLMEHINLLSEVKMMEKTEAQSSSARPVASASLEPRERIHVAPSQVKDISKELPVVDLNDPAPDCQDELLRALDEFQHERRALEHRKQHLIQLVYQLTGHDNSRRRPAPRKSADHQDPSIDREKAQLSSEPESQRPVFDASPESQPPSRETQAQIQRLQQDRDHLYQYNKAIEAQFHRTQSQYTVERMGLHVQRHHGLLRQAGFLHWKAMVHRVHWSR